MGSSFFLEVRLRRRSAALMSMESNNVVASSMYSGTHTRMSNPMLGCKQMLRIWAAFSLRMCGCVRASNRYFFDAALPMALEPTATGSKPSSVPRSLALLNLSLMLRWMHPSTSP